MSSDQLITAADGERHSRNDLLPGTEVGDLVVGELLARGGCGAVYHARLRDGRRAVLKVLHASLAQQPKMIERFMREIEVVCGLGHPAIVAIEDAGFLHDRRPYYAMEYLEGGTLDDMLRSRGRLTPEEALDVLEPVCGALAAAHDAGIVHRDVKASNIAFTAEHRVKLLDFGIAKLSLGPDHTGLTTVGRQLGTPAIMAPEQLLGGPVDARVDVYALGVLLHRLVTGRPPFEASTPAALARKHLEEPAPRPSRLANVGPAIDAVVLRCMEKRPERRFDSTKSFVAALAAAVGRDYEGPHSSRAVPTLGIAVYLDLRVNITGDELDDALGRDVGTLLDLAEERLSRGGFALVQATGSGVLGVRPAGHDEAALRRDRRAAIALASALHAQIASRPGADARVHANVALHVGEVMLHHEGAREIVGGSLISTAAWAPRSEMAGIAVTAAMIEGLGELDAPLTVLPL